MRIAINGFGRIGRTILRQIITQQQHRNVEVVHVNDIAAADMLAYLFQYDSTFGPLPVDLKVSGGNFILDGRTIAVSHTDDLTQLDLSDVDVLLECTGIARTSDVAERGLKAGARSVLISGPSPAAEATIVLGANENQLGHHRIVSNASCTTNALAPLLSTLNDICGVETAHMTTIHCYTNSQPMVDAPRGDFARSRAGALSMVPTTSSATHLVDVVLPHLAGRISGAAVRVPVASVSAVDLVLQMKTETFKTSLNALTLYNGIPSLEALDKPTLMIAGEEDPACTATGMRKMNEIVKDSTIHVLDGVGHYGFAEAPEAYRGHVLAFLAERFGSNS